MQCPKCQFENREEAKFCKKCGNKLERLCPACGHPYHVDSLFCDECGCDIGAAKETSSAISETESPSQPPSPEKPTEDVAPNVSERKHVTVLFSDLTGYTAMSEKLDPEEVKEITSRIFGEISKIVANYDGFIEKYAGDAVMAIFGAPQAHEDDPIRAIKAAREIHQLVDAISPDVEKKIGQSISMHTGINTGLVVTGEVDMQRGTHGIAGDTINLASRLSNLAKTGEILVNVNTCRQIEGHFTCEYSETTTVKGKTEPVQVHKVISQREKPVTIRRLSGLRADLIGRRAETDQLGEAIKQLREGKGKIFSICGDAGTGKSRLIEEFKVSCDLEEIQWLEGHAYSYSQNIPYFPMIDLLNRVFQIEEGDSPEKVRLKVESGVENLVGKKEEIIPSVGSLYSLSYPEIEAVSPEFWKSQLRDAVGMILSALAQRAPTIFLLEDLHWADPAFIEFLRHTLLKIRQPAIVLCVYRPVFSLFTTHQLRSIAKVYREIRIQNLSSTEAQDMLESILKADNIPDELRRFVQNKAEGNPFYLEELVNSLIESETLIRDNGSWEITKPITEIGISTTIHGVISGRIDRLERETKRILQEASVIGRTFLYEIINRITELKDQMDRSLQGLERLDLIRIRSLQPDLEYIFKHALTQEVVYNGLLKKERRRIHENIGSVMEQLFEDRLPEFYETLAYHFSRGESFLKAVDYLARSGEKCLKRFAVEESHQFFEQAYDITANKSDKTEKELEILIDLIIKWAMVFYYRGDFRGLINLYTTNEGLAKSLKVKKSLGMFYAWFGFAKLNAGDGKGSYEYLREALKLGEEIDDYQLIGYACCWLSWTCSSLGFFEEAIDCGDRAQGISKMFESDHYLYFKTLGGIAYTCYYMGDRKRPIEIGKELLEFGQRHSNIRSKVIGHISIGLGELVSGDYLKANTCFKKAVQISQDPWYREYSRVFLGLSYLLHEQMDKAEEELGKVYEASFEIGFEGSLGVMSETLLGIVTVAKGELSRGLKAIERGSSKCKELGTLPYYAMFEYILGKVYLQMVQGDGPKNFSFLAKNIGFLIKNLPFASQKAEKHLLKTITVTKEIGAKGILGQAYLDLGLLYRSKKRSKQAIGYISQAIQLFEQCEAELFLKQAKEILASM